MVQNHSNYNHILSGGYWVWDIQFVPLDVHSRKKEVKENIEMGEWSPYKLSTMDKEILEIYLKHGLGYMKMYDNAYFLPTLCDEIVLLTLEEFAEKCKEYEENK